MPNVHVVEVFKSSQGGGNPAPVVIDAVGLEAEQMMAVARAYGHESGFVLPATSGNDYRFRFFVPRHEMSMCGHATIGTVWLLHTLGKLGSCHLSIETLSGNVSVQIHGKEGEQPFIEISQPAGVVSPINKPELRDSIIHAIGLEPEDILDLPLLNSATSRVKTLIPVKNPERLDAAVPDSTRIEELCEELDSTGFYLFCAHPGKPRQFDSRQFPKSSGYPEDAATGIAATALAFGLLKYEMIKPGPASMLIHQGRAMGRPSDIHVRFDVDETGSPHGCFVGGYSAFAPTEHAHE
ncbi:PhzF family phenazine biosynthesis protein [Pseudomonas sp. HN11]|uniref:PhzF family phenazine biosynthesis protein n=1 Tax=Pseudomonas sp. HN11 TaxID=1344094 RepID=UPI001F1B0C1C|nr:PhzF family phenazine biosynthesis protein [Pseudomonas sp. HN11]UII69869.1 PhzF family phenazine biosynthesis protein [Pseudomonas sp. HN11]